ncbi:MAG: transaldolase [Alphaproteobacteria bacterium]|jgi:transaldolase|nr:transaldolase [Alphaproteobacteria bacterium]MDF3033761.1 transaldolase [Alphaproteobacteria bacterium]
MLFFLDTADVTEVKALAETGMIDGITTNPSLAASSGIPFPQLIAQMCALVEGPVSAEVMAPDAATMVTQGRQLAKISKNVTIKVPLTVEGLKACQTLSHEEIMVNVTLCFSATQALLAAKAGAAFISPFIGRLDDISQSGMELIKDIRLIYDTYGFETAVLAASIRHPMHIVEAAKAGADAATMPPKVLRQLYQHPLTDLGLENFLKDWNKSGLSI